MRLKQYIAESTKIWYHGRSVKSDVFDYKFIDIKGNNQDGPGFYFTDSIDDASQYVKGTGFILKCELHPKKIVTNKTKVSPAIIRKLMKMAPRLNDVLSNWGENPKEAFEDAFSAIYSYKDSPIDVFQQIWADFYHITGNSLAFVKNMVKIGFDATEPPSRWDSKHLIMYNPQKIKVLNSL